MTGPYVTPADREKQERRRQLQAAEEAWRRENGWTSGSDADDEAPWPEEPIPLHAAEPAPAGRRAGSPLLGWADLLSEPDEPPPMLATGIPKVGCTVLAGAPKVGKSLYATQTALELGCRVLYVAEEGSRRGIAWRLRRQAAVLEVSDPPLSLAHLHRIRLDNAGSVRSLRSLVESVGATLVIVDPLNKAHGADENRPAQMTPVMDALSAIAYDFGIAVLAVHHLSKPSQERRGDIWDRFRGAGSIRSGTDANLILDGTGAIVHLVGEFRDAEPLSAYLTLDREALVFRPAEGPKAPTTVDPVALLALVRLRGKVTARDVMERFKVGKVTALSALAGCEELDHYEGARGQLTYFLTVQ